jgi:uncharacterized protein YkwD
MNWIDLLLIAVIGLGAWSGWKRGFISGMLGLLTWVGSLAAGFFFYMPVTSGIERITLRLGAWAQPVGFLVTLLIARLLLSAFAGVLLRQAPEEAHRHAANKALGLVPGFFNGLLYAIIISALLLTLPVQNAVSDKTRESSLANQFMQPANWLEDRLAPIFSEPLRNTVAKPAATHKGTESVTLPYKVARSSVREDLEAKMLDLVNEERQKAGLKPVAADPEMTVVARAHSKDMFAKGFFAHVNVEGKDPFDRMRAGSVKFRTAGENLALARTLQQAHNGLMNSPGHRANILQPRFGRLGIGILDGGIYGLMVTQNFRN